MSDPQVRLDGLPPGSSITVSVDWLRSVLSSRVKDAPHDMTVMELAERFERSPSTIRSWLEQGSLRGYRRRGREWRVTVAAVEEFEANEREGGKRSTGKRGEVADLSAWRTA